MKQVLSITSILFFMNFGLFAQEESENISTITKNFKGEWVIDLRPTPESEGYYKSFVVDSINEKSFSGSFYGSPIEDALLNNDWENISFAFTTHDNTYAYYHSGYVKDGRVYGISYCPGRGFTLPWNGDKKE